MSGGDDIDDLIPDWGKDNDEVDGPPIPGWDHVEADHKPAKPSPKPVPAGKSAAQSTDPSIRVPPHNLEAEQAVIGGLMLDQTMWSDVIRLVSPRDFYSVQNSIVFDAMSTLQANRQPFDPVTVAASLQETNRLDQVGGIAYLAELVEATPGSTNTIAYARIVASTSQRRRVIRKASSLAEKAFGDADDFEEALVDLQRTRIDRGEQLSIYTSGELRAMGAPIPWIWKGWLPEGMLTLLAGEKGRGKSTLAMAVAACLTTGKVPWDDGPKTETRRVLYWSGEDDVRIIVGRALAAGVALDRFGVIGTVGVSGVSDVPFDPATHMPMLLDHIKDDPPDLLILDPLIRILKGKNSSAEDVRRSLDPVAAQAEQLGIAILGIGHFAKASGDRSILDRFLGSQAWAARARMCWALVGAGTRTLFGKAATNIAPQQGVMDVSVKERTVQFENGTTDLYTYTVFSDLNFDQTIDEVERIVVADHEKAEMEAKRSEKYDADLQAATAWFWDRDREGFCTSAEWEAYCQVQGWSTKSGQSKGRKMAAMLGLKLTRRGAPGSQITYWYLPGVDPTTAIK